MDGLNGEHVRSRRAQLMTAAGSTVPSIKRLALLPLQGPEGTPASCPRCRHRSVPVVPVVAETLRAAESEGNLSQSGVLIRMPKTSAVPRSCGAASATAPASLLLAFIVHFLQSTYHCHQVHSFLLQNGAPLRLVRVIILQESLLNLGLFVCLLPAYRLLLA